MRENTVTSVTENALSTLVGEFVNDAKRLVEDAWQWGVLNDTVNIVTADGTISYDLEDFTCASSGAPPTERSRLRMDEDDGFPLIRITTAGFERIIPLVGQDYRYAERAIASNNGDRATPEVVLFGVNRLAVAGRSKLRVFPFPTPDAVYTIQMHLVDIQNDLDEGSDVLLVPKEPVIQFAYLYALYERGEELGERLPIVQAKAQAALSDAIALDAQLTGGRLGFSPPTSFI